MSLEFSNSVCPLLVMRKKNNLHIFISIIIFLIGVELTLRILSIHSFRGSLFSARNIIELTVKDKRLGLRPNPKFPGHDQKGFRNKFVPEQASIVAMGDSQTYGATVEINEAWPQQLEYLSKIKTYNMAFGGYGPTHSLILLPEAINLKPKLIIEAFYAGNDLYDSYSHIYDMKQLPELKCKNKVVIKNIIALEKKEPLLREIQRLFRMERKAGKDEQLYEVLDRGGFKTVFTPAYRLCALNLRDIRIREGLRISLEAIKLIQEKAKTLNIEFIVLLIPTKELVFKDIVYNNSDNTSLAYKTLIENEEIFWRQARDFLKKEGIYFIDALFALRECLSNNLQPYPASLNGHPSAIGHRAIAKAVLSELEKFGLLDKIW